VLGLGLSGRMLRRSLRRRILQRRWKGLFRSV